MARLKQGLRQGLLPKLKVEKLKSQMSKVLSKTQVLENRFLQMLKLIHLFNRTTLQNQPLGLILWLRMLPRCSTRAKLLHLKGNGSFLPLKASKDIEGGESQSDSESDYLVELDDEDYYDIDDFDPDIDSSKRSSFDHNQREEFLGFMKDFIDSYSTRPSRDTRHNAHSSYPLPSQKSLRFASEGRKSKEKEDKHDNSFSFGCMSIDSPGKVPTNSRSSSHDSALINSLRNNKASNKLAETFLQLAGLSHKDSTDLFRSANAKKSGEHWKASDCAPIPIK